jgi:hypothetical protein
MFRRRSRSESVEPDALDDQVDDAAEDAEEADGPVQGPWDADDVADDGIDRVDLGSLRGLRPRAPSSASRSTSRPATCSPRCSPVTRSHRAAGLRGTPGRRPLERGPTPDRGRRLQHGGTATEREGRWGIELVCQMQVVMPDGTQAMQPSRIVGVNGPRWLLRATFLGLPAVQPDDAEVWEDALAAVVVHRGSHAMPVGDALPLTLPDDAQRA